MANIYFAYGALCLWADLCLETRWGDCDCLLWKLMRTFSSPACACTCGVFVCVCLFLIIQIKQHPIQLPIYLAPWNTITIDSMDQGNPVATPALLHIMLMMLRAASWPLPFWEPIIAFRLRISVPWQHIHGNSCLQWTATIKNLNDSILVPTSSVYFLLPCWRKCPLSPLREVIMWWGLRFYKVNTL